MYIRLLIISLLILGFGFQISFAEIASFKSNHPYCRFFVDPDAPLMILIGELDDWTPAYRCARAIPSMPTEYEIHLKIYPGAYHDFDWHGMNMLYRGNRLKYDAAAAEDAIIRVKDFLAKYAR